MKTFIEGTKAASPLRLSKILLGMALIATLGSPVTQSTLAARTVGALSVDMLSTPLGLDDPQPMFSWKIYDATEGARQTAYRVRVGASASDVQTPARAGGSGPDLLWDSGKIESAQSIEIRYQGKPLAASRRYFWRVESWDKDGRSYPVSEVSHWDTGLVNTYSWKGQWIGYEQPEDKSIRNRMLNGLPAFHCLETPYRSHKRIFQIRIADMISGSSWTCPIRSYGT